MKSVLFIGIIFLLGCQSSVNDNAESQRVLGEEYAERWTPDQVFPELYAAIQQNQVFRNPLTFANARPKFSIEKINQAYSKLKNTEDRQALLDFAKNHFELPPQRGQNFETPAENIVDHIESLWPILTKTANEKTPTTQIAVPFPYLVSNGMSNTLTYWDSYFAMLGMQASSQNDLLENMVKNFAHLINQFGYIPMGNRNYLLSRSHPPFFAFMVDLLAEEKGSSVYTEYLEPMRLEYLFWMDGFNQELLPKTSYRRIVKLYDGKILNRYFDDGIGPRTEAFAKDLRVKEESGRDEKVYKDIRAASESGWTFSSRWCRREVDLNTIHTTEIIPVDLNALLYHLEMTLSKAYEISGDSDNQNLYSQNAAYRKAQIVEKCWDNVAGYFMDYDWAKNQKTGKPTLAGLYTLFCGMATQEQAERSAAFAERFLLRPGGLAPSILNSGHEWDNPYGWAPLQYIAVKGLRNYGLNGLADQVTSRWLRTVDDYFRSQGRIIEKYNINQGSRDAVGMAYGYEDGYGWTNGVYLAFKRD